MSGNIRIKLSAIKALTNINSINITLPFSALLFLIVNSIFATSFANAESIAGKTLLAHGKVFAKRTEGDISLKRRSSILTNDEIHVGEGAKAQFRMKDKAIISLKENSILKIKNYQFNDRSKKDSAVLELISGGFRTITGAIGKKNKKDYELRTPLATIGIRGTDFEIDLEAGGMHVSIWDGAIHLRSTISGGCNMLLGESHSFQFVSVDASGKCTGHKKKPKIKNKQSSAKKPTDPESKETETETPTTPDEDNYVGSDSSDDVLDPATPAPIKFSHSGFVLKQAQPTLQINSTVSSLTTSSPNIEVNGSNLTASGGNSIFQQDVGGYGVSWGYWADSVTTPTNSPDQPDSLIWAGYDATNTNIVSAKTGTVTYDNVNNSLSSASAGQVSNLQAQMDVNFTTGAVANGALSASTSIGSTPIDTWVAVFNGQLDSGALNLTLHGASVIDANPSTPSPVRPASGYIEGDFIGTNAEAILGAFGLSEDNNTSNHIEGVFTVKP